MNITATSTRRARVGILWGPAPAQSGGRDQQTSEREGGRNGTNQREGAISKMKARSTGPLIPTSIAEARKPSPGILWEAVKTGA